LPEKQVKNLEKIIDRKGIEYKSIISRNALASGCPELCKTVG
jgi:hypothetical protein